MNRRLRIGIMGAGGSGKTTLARLLCTALEMPLIDEGVREWLASRKLTKPDRLPWDLQLQLQAHFVTAKMRQESEHHAFVSDRTTLDAVVNLLMRRVHHGAQAKIPQQFTHCALKHACQTYDQIVLLRWNDGPRPVPDGIREVNPERLRHEYDLCVALCELIGLRTTIVNAHPTDSEIDLLLELLKE